jgi:hypothetical protein
MFIHNKILFKLKVEIRFLGSGELCFPLRNTISHIWITHGRKMFPIEFGVKRTLKYKYGFRALE